MCDFYPRSPCGERHGTDGVQSESFEFLSTLSLRRATNPGQPVRGLPGNFYPRSPCGERRQRCAGATCPCNFYPRSPCGERHVSVSYRRDRFYFYPRSPCGERPEIAAKGVGSVVFLSTLSLRRATPLHGRGITYDAISIHALLAESDFPLTEASAATRYFYPRSPCGERL